MMLAAAVAASPRRREVAFMFPEGTVLLIVSSVWDWDESEFGGSRKKSVSTVCIHFPNGTQQTDRQGVLF
jgi:hypothetical protein